MHNNLRLDEYVTKFRLQLNGLRIYTEAASGHYAYGPILAALAGAKHVTAQTRSSRFGTAEQVIALTERLANTYGVSHLVKCVEQRDYRYLSAADIVTNTGHVRPIDRDLIDALKPTAVIPLMWETWEFREIDFDLKYCHERQILVLGTNERVEPCDMRRFIGMSGLKLLLDLDYDGSPVLLIGNSPLPGATLVDALRKLNMDVTWCSDDPRADIRYADLPVYFDSSGYLYSHLIVAEHLNPILVLGKDGLLQFDLIKSVNPDIGIGIMCGNVDAIGMRESGLRFMPQDIAPFGFMSYQPAVLGPRPVITLFAAGLKVGERMAKARLSGQSLDEATRMALCESPAMTFEQ